MAHGRSLQSLIFTEQSDKKTKEIREDFAKFYLSSYTTRTKNSFLELFLRDLLSRCWYTCSNIRLRLTVARSYNEHRFFVTIVLVVAMEASFGIAWIRRKASKIVIRTNPVSVGRGVVGHFLI